GHAFVGDPVPGCGVRRRAGRLRNGQAHGESSTPRGRFRRIVGTSPNSYRAAFQRREPAQPGTLS
ncbi:hypothetical protein ACFWQL_38995, partial [Amycolatopsis thermoflava]